MRIRKVNNPSALPLDTAQVVDSYSTSTTDAYSANYVNELNEKGFISLTKSSEQTIGTTGESTVTFDTIIGKSGTDFSFSNNTITCNFSGYVEVSAQVQWSSAGNTNTHNIYIYQNEYILARSLNAAYTNGGNKVGWITPMILQVWNGNTFKLTAHSNSGEKLNSVANGTHFTIKRL